MAHVCTVAGGKGGVGKTTTTIDLGVALADRGFDVAIVDGDLGMTNLAGMIGLDHGPTLHDALAGEVTPREATVEGPGGVAVLPGSERLSAFASADPANLAPVLDAIRPNYDAIVVDTGVGLSQETVVPMELADSALLVSTPDEVAVADARKMATLADHVDTRVLGSVVTRARPETSVPDLSADLDLTVLAAVPEDPAATADEPLVLESPDSYAAEAYRTLARKVGQYVTARASQ
ncbi:MAG: MinD/ParA family protein [Haloarculaceae archaeon]